MTSQNVPWKRLVRYVGPDGLVKYGEPILSNDRDDVSNLYKEGILKVHVCDGTDIWSATPTSKAEVVKQLLGPLEVKDVPIIRCIGLNYKSHSKYRPFLVILKHS